MLLYIFLGSSVRPVTLNDHYFLLLVPHYYIHQSIQILVLLLSMRAFQRLVLELGILSETANVRNIDVDLFVHVMAEDV